MSGSAAPAVLREPGYLPLSTGPPVLPNGVACRAADNRPSWKGATEDSSCRTFVVPFACVAAMTAALVLSSRSPRGSAPPASVAAADAAVSWLTTQQQPDGGFELAGFPGFETLDAAIAIAGQRPDRKHVEHERGRRRGRGRAVRRRRARLRSTPSMPTPRRSRPWGPDHGHRGEEHRARREPVRVRPERLRPRRRRHAGRPGRRSMGGCSATGGSDVQLHPLHRPRREPRVRRAVGRRARRPCVTRSRRTVGGTSSATRRHPTSIPTRPRWRSRHWSPAAPTPPIRRSRATLGFFATNQQASGAWQSFGVDDPNSTSLSILGITAAGYDVESSCWRDTAAPVAGRHSVREPDRVAALAAAHRAAGRRGPHREPQRQLRREHVRHLADRSRPSCSRGYRSRGRPSRPAATPVEPANPLPVVVDAEVHRMTVGARVAGPSSRSRSPRHSWVRARLHARTSPRRGAPRAPSSSSRRPWYRSASTARSAGSTRCGWRVPTPSPTGSPGRARRCASCTDAGNPADQSCLIGPGGQYWAYFRAAPGATGWTYSHGGASSSIGRRRLGRGMAVRHRCRTGVRELLLGRELRATADRSATAAADAPRHRPSPHR